MKSLNRIIARAAVLLAALAAGTSLAQTLGVYSFTGASDGTQAGFPVESPAPNVNFSTLENTGLSGVGVMSAFSANTESPNSNNGNPPYPFDGKGFEATYPSIRTSTDPDASNDFLQFSVTPAAGHRLTIDNITADLGTDFTTTFQVEVRYNLWYSLDGTTFYKIGDPSAIPTNSYQWRIRNDVNKSFVANAAAIPNGTETIYFRLAFGLTANSGSSDKRLFVDDIRINGTSDLIPDPDLVVDLVNTDEIDYNFGNVFSNESRKVTFICNSQGGLGTVNIDDISITEDAGGLFTLGAVTWSNTGSQPLLSNGDSVTIEVIANNSQAGNFNGQLTIDTTSAGGTSGADDNDLVLPFNSTTYANQALLNANPLMTVSLTGWISNNATFVTPGIAPGSPGMARVRGKGDPAGTVLGSLSQTAVPNGFSDFQLISHFTPINDSNFAAYVDPDGSLGVTGPNGNFTDRTFQWVLLGSDTSPPNPGFGDTQAANTLINLAYLPDGDSSGGTPDFYVFDSVAESWVATGIGAIAGSVDNDTDGNAANGVGDGRLDTSVDPLDVINVYRLVVTGTGLGTPTASYNVSVTKVSGPDGFTTGSATGLTAFHGLDGTANTGNGHAFITSDTSDSNSLNGFRTPFWVDDTAIFNVTAPDPNLTVLTTPGAIVVTPPTTTGTTSFLIRNDGTATNLEVTSITTGTSGFTVTSATSFSLAPGAVQQIDVQWNSAASAYTPSYETGTLTINSSNHAPAVVNLVAGVLIDYPTALNNGSFETPGTDNVTDTDTFADWNEAPGVGTPDPTKVTDVPGLIAPSVTAAAIAPSSTGSSARLAQNLTSPPLVNFTLDFDFAVPKVGRDLYFFLETATNNLQRTNIGYNSTANTFIVFDQVTNGFINLLPINLTAGTPYKLRVTGTNWGFANVSTTLEVFNPAGVSLGVSTPFAYFQGTAPVGGLISIGFSTEFGGSGGVTLDEVSISGQSIDTSPPPPPAELRLVNSVFVPGSPNQVIADVTGGTVDIYRSTTLEPGSWTGPIVSGLVPGTGLVIDPNAMLPKAFYIGVEAGGTAP